MATRTLTGFDPEVTEEQRALTETAKEFADEHLAPHAVRWDQEKHFPIDVLRKAAQLGMGGIYAAEDHGGSGLGRFDAVQVFEALATGCPSIAGYYLISGVKQFISGAGSSELYLVFARTGEPGARGISAFVVDRETPGLSVGPNEIKMGWNAQPTRQVILEGTRVPERHRLGAEGDGFRIAMSGLDGGRLNIAACPLGGARPRWNGPSPICWTARCSAFRWPSSRRCGSGWSTCTPSSRPRDGWSGRGHGPRTAMTRAPPRCA